MKRVLLGSVLASGLSSGQSLDLLPVDEMLTLSAHANTVVGTSSGDPGELAVHGHDPNQDATIQALELSLSVRANDYVEAFVGVNTFLNLEDELDGEWEEGFVKLKNLPGGFELRGGRYLNRLGSQNNVHLHGWDFVDANLSTGFFLGEDGLRTEGIELSWFGETGQARYGISTSFGNALEHSHDHGGHAHEEHEDHDHDDHDHHDEHEDHDEHGHDEEHDEHGEAREMAYFVEDLVTTRAFVNYRHTDFHQHELGLSYAQGRNGYRRDTKLFGMDYEYQWRENGLEAGG
ncbi:MAG: hypothetical protein ACQKBY_05690, partial [Verrucomicrobiales bacterium]